LAHRRTSDEPTGKKRLREGRKKERKEELGGKMMWSGEMLCLLLVQSDLISVEAWFSPKTANSPPFLTISVSSFSRSALNVNCTWGTFQGVLRRSLFSAFFPVLSVVNLLADI
jgi:hypothetical protein